jgi:peptidylprolyl isomerase
MFRALSAALLLAALATTATAQAPDAAASAVPASNPADWKPLDPANTLVIDTTQGRIVVEMHPEMAPLHVTRMKVLSRQGYFNDSLFYRVLAFAAQGGDKNKTFRSPLPNLKDEFFFQTGPATPYAVFGTPTAYQSSQTGAPPAGDQGFVGAMPVVTDAAAPNARSSALFCPGVASFAHGSAPDTANSQVFFQKTRGWNLERNFTVWGRVVQGQDVVEKLKMGEPPPPPADKMVRVRVMSDMPPADRPTLQVMDTRSAAFAALVAQVRKEKDVAFTLCDVPVPGRQP